MLLNLTHIEFFYLFWKFVNIFNIWTEIMNEMKNGLWNLLLVWDPNENNDNPILYKWFSAHLIAITHGKGFSTSKLFIINSMSTNAREITKPYNLFIKFNYHKKFIYLLIVFLIYIIIKKIKYILIYLKGFQKYI